MDRGQFTQAEIEELRCNPYVHDVNRTSISYSKEFKQKFMQEYETGKRPVQIFRDAGFDPAMLGSKRIERACARWKEAYRSGTLDRREAVLRKFDEAEENGDHEGEGAGDLDVGMLCRAQEKKIRMLQMEVEFFRRLCQRSQQMNPEALSADIACRIISEIAQEEEYAGCVSHLCEVAGISRALYYHYKHRRERAE